MDLSPLERKPTPQESAHLKSLRRQGAFGPSSSSQTLFLVLFLMAFLGMGGWITTVVAQGMRQSGMIQRTPIAALFRPEVFFGFVALVVGIPLLVSFFRRADWHKLALFALANGRQYRLRDESPTYPGMIFGLGHDRYCAPHLFKADDTLRDVGTHHWSTGSGDDESSFARNFAAFHLGRRLPHLVLDSRKNNGLGSNLPVGFRKSQRQSLGAAIDDRFVVYAPEGYGADTYQLFPPQVMEALTRCDTFDIEIVDDWMFVYFATPLDDPRLWHNLEYLRDCVATHLATARYIDRHAPELATAPYSTTLMNSAPVAPQGSRLRTSRVGISAVMIVMILWWFFGRFIMTFLGQILLHF